MEATRDLSSPSSLASSSRFDRTVQLPESPLDLLYGRQECIPYRSVTRLRVYKIRSAPREQFVISVLLIHRLQRLAKYFFSSYQLFPCALDGFATGNVHYWIVNDLSRALRQPAVRLSTQARPQKGDS